MRRHLLLSPWALAVACAGPSQPPPAPPPTPLAERSSALVRVAVEEPRQEPARIASEEALGAPVEDAAGAPLGTVNDLLIDPATGALERVVVHAAAGEDRELHWADGTWTRRDGGLVLTVLEGRELALRPASAAARALEVREPETLRGEVASKEAVVTAEGVAELRITLRGRNNHYHRATLGPLDQVPLTGVPLEPGQPLELSGHFTRDAKGKLLVARSMTIGDREFELAARGATEPATPVDLRSLAGVSVQTADGALVEVSGFVLGLVPTGVASVHLRLNGEPRRIEWRRLGFDRDTGWRTDLTLEQLKKLPAASDAPPEAQPAARS